MQVLQPGDPFSRKKFTALCPRACPSFVGVSCHLDHRSSKSLPREQPLRCFVPLGRGKNDLRNAARFQFCQHSVEEQASHAATTKFRIDNDVLNDSRRTPQSHVVVALDGCIGVADDVAVVIGHQDDHVRVFELATEKTTIIRRRPVARLQKSARVEVIVRIDEQRSKDAESRRVGADRGADDESCGHVGKVSPWRSEFATLMAARGMLIALDAHGN